MQSKLLKTTEDITYGISIINDLLGLVRTEEATRLIKEVDKKNASLINDITIGEVVDIDATILRCVINRYSSKRRVSYANKV